jgi:carbon monoxide dehydrogenase subunit G
MELNGTHNFTAAPAAVWAALHNATMLQNAIPGAEEVSWQSDSALSVRAKIEIGPINRSFGIMAQVVEQTPPSHLKFSLNRQGVSSRVEGELAVDLAPNGSGTTLTYAGTARLEGPIAIADNPLTRPLAHKAVDQFFENLGKQIS